MAAPVRFLSALAASVAMMGAMPTFSSSGLAMIPPLGRSRGKRGRRANSAKLADRRRVARRARVRRMKGARR